jgi:hypothetical protein
MRGFGALQTMTALEVMIDEAAAAKAPLDSRQQMLVEGIPTRGGSHPSALRHNRINKTRERLDIPSGGGE